MTSISRPRTSSGPRLAAALIAAGACLGLAYYVGTRSARVQGVGAAPQPAPEPAAERARTLAAVGKAFESARAQPPAEAAPWTASPASPPAAQTALEERDSKVLELQRSGPDRRNLLAQANAVGAAWKALADKSKADVRFGPWTCHAGGCFVTAQHATAGSVDTFSDEVTKTDEFLEWNSPKMRSGPIERSDGTVEITWILYAPGTEEAAPAASGEAAARANP